MYHIGDQVVYGIHGVCRIVDEEKSTVDRKTVTFLVLEPVDQEGTRYLVPSHNETAMGKLRPMLSADELETLIQSPEVHSDGWIQDENGRKQLYRELISSGDRVSFLRMLHTLYLHRKSRTAAGRKVHQADENFLRDAEKLLASEISVIMDISHEEAKTYLRNRLGVE